MTLVLSFFTDDPDSEYRSFSQLLAGAIDFPVATPPRRGRDGVGSKMGMVGFNIGNDNCMITTMKQRGIDILLNDESKRETPTMVSFGKKQHFLGSTGATSATMNPRSTISQVKRLIRIVRRCCTCAHRRSREVPMLALEGFRKVEDSRAIGKSSKEQKENRHREGFERTKIK
ncbi:hypothetical protein COCNU_06G018610 [Cocos nucifera]|uniref:Uncharacterized protein n=1 Tax=Cocos nucifera TaxID=13894 RepID=A0A8K0IDU7_COCNU|nr:hypothetical protein COCNU_06G018610 [Cocos nucifera]